MCSKSKVGITSINEYNFVCLIDIIAKKIPNVAINKYTDIMVTEYWFNGIGFILSAKREGVVVISPDK